VVVILWGLSIPVIGAIGTNISSKVTYAVDNINTASYSPQDKTLIEESVREKANNEMTLFSLGLIHLREGNDEKAASVFSAMGHHFGARSDLLLPSLVNLGVIYYNQGNAKESTPVE